MIKRDELSSPNSCMAKALDDEMVFVLLARDKAAPAAILHWCTERIALGLNLPTDQKIQDAMRSAQAMIQAQGPGRLHD